MSGKHGTIQERFWRYVRKGPGCWEWTGAKSPSGYGQIRKSKNVLVTAHRLSYEIHYRPIPDGLYILHKCDRPSCVRPSHLELGTPSKNIRDAFYRGRHNKRRLVSREEITNIRRRRKEGWVLSEIGNEIGFTSQTIWRIIHGQSLKRFQRVKEVKDGVKAAR